MATPAPNNKVDICNIALSYLAEDFVTDIDTPPVGDDTAALCKKHYPKVRRAVLRGHTWNFAIKRAQLAADATAPAFGFSKRYKLPPNFIRFMSKHDELGNRYTHEFVEGTDYQIEDGYILTSDNGSGVLNMRYIYDNETVADWDPLFVDLMTVELALSMAMEFKSSPRAISNLKDTRRELKAEAKAVDGQDRPPVRIQNSRFLNARKYRSSTVASKYTVFE